MFLFDVLALLYYFIKIGHGPFSHIFDKVKKEIMKDVPEIQKVRGKGIMLYNKPRKNNY